MVHLIQVNDIFKSDLKLVFFGNRDMSEINFYYIGWCKGIDNGVNHDKVWTAFEVNNRYYAGWGRRGKTLRFKKHNDLRELMKVKRKKEKTYKEVDRFQLFAIFPYFEDEVSKYLTYSIMKDKVI